MLADLLTKILCDTPPAVSADAAYIFAQTEDNHSSVLNRAAALLEQERTAQLLIPDSEPRCGYPGFVCWQRELLERGVRDTQIRFVATGMFESLNTLTEAQAAVRHCKAESLEILLVIAAPFHQLRAFMTVVSVVLAEYPELNAFSAVGEALPWYETVRHSQGKLRGAREEFIQTELERISKYEQKGDLLGMGQILEYLRRRDAKS